MGLKLGIDMDGTIANFTEESFHRVKELYGITMTVEEDAYMPKTSQLVWEKLSPEQQAKYKDHRELYREICVPGFFLGLKPFPGAVEAVRELAAEGHKIFFVTKPLNWDRSAPEKIEWLKKYFPDMEYSIIMVNSTKAKGILDLDVMVDDDLRVLDNISLAARICIAQPWNERGRNRMDLVAADMAEAADIIRDYYTDIVSWWEHEWRQDETADYQP
jgi:5'(3')-deoxyribonucleotidase